jgi:hypothetical protein
VFGVRPLKVPVRVAPDPDRTNPFVEVKTAPFNVTLIWLSAMGLSSNTLNHAYPVG